MLILTTLILSLPTIDLYPTPPGVANPITIPCTLKLDVYGNGRFPITGCDYVEFWGSRYAVSGPTTVMITGGLPNQSVEIVPEPSSLGMMLLAGMYATRKKRG